MLQNCISKQEVAGILRALGRALEDSSVEGAQECYAQSESLDPSTCGPNAHELEVENLKRQLVMERGRTHVEKEASTLARLRMDTALQGDPGSVNCPCAVWGRINVLAGGHHPLCVWATVAKLREENERLRRERAEDVWLWMDQLDENKVESLACPVLMTADQVRALVDAAVPEPPPLREIARRLVDIEDGDIHGLPPEILELAEDARRLVGGKEKPDA